MYPIDGTDPLENARAIINELEKFSPTLAERERWLVLNKADLVDAEEAEAIKDTVVAGLNWQGPVYVVSAANRLGTEVLCEHLLTHLEEQWEAERESAELAEAEKQRQIVMQQEAREHIKELRERHFEKRRALKGKGGDDLSDDLDDDDWNEDDYDVEFEYAP